MCYTAYIATDIKQSEGMYIPDETFLYLKEESLEKEIHGLKGKFSKPNIYYVGSYEGCSCGFSYDVRYYEEMETDEEDRIEQARKIKSINALKQLIIDITKNGTLEFYCCWEGDWELPIQEWIQTDSKALDNFKLTERQFILFK